MITPDLRYVVENLKYVLGFVIGPDRSPLLDGAIEIAQGKAVLSRPQGGHTTQSERGGERRIIRVGLLERRVTPVIAKAKFVGEAGTEDVRLAEHKVLCKVEILLASIPAAIEDGTKREGVQHDIVHV